MTRSEPPAEVIEAPEFGGRLGLTARRLALYADECALALKQAGYLGKGQSLEAKAADVIESLRASSSLGGIEGGVQREDALTAGAQSQTKAAMVNELARVLQDFNALQQCAQALAAGHTVPDMTQFKIWSKLDESERDYIRPIAAVMLKALDAWPRILTTAEILKEAK